MEKICVIGSNLYELSNTVISFAKSDIAFENKIVVPDKFSLLAEINYFQMTGTECSFDTQVISISSLAHWILNQIGIDAEVISSQQQALLVKKAIDNCQDKLKTIKSNNNSGFYMELSKTISQLKSSKVDLAISDETGIGKIDDFKIIIEEYEKLRQGRFDNNDLISILEENLKNCKALKNTKFYFAGFDSFTNQVFDIIKEISKYSDVVFGALVPIDKNMSNIYDLDIYKKVQAVFDNVRYVMCEKTLNYNQSLIENNLFSRQKYVGKKNDYLQVLVSKSIEEEIDFVFNMIANKMKDGHRPNEYSIAIANLNEDVMLHLEDRALFYNLPIYIDQPLNLKNTSLFRFIENIFNIYLSNFSKEYLINFWLADFVDLEFFEKSKIINLINEYSLYENNYKKLTNFISDNSLLYFNKLLFFIENIKKTHNYSVFCKFLMDLLNEFSCQNILEQNANKFKIENKLKHEKLYLQVYQKFISAVEALSNMLPDYRFNLNEFKDDFFTICENTKISTVPISSNCVYIADATDNFFAVVKNLFILGASGESLPRTIYDCGLILDSDIESVKALKNISPTINMLNKRNKFKLYNLCLCPTENLFVSYSLIEGGKDIPCYFIDDLLNIFGKTNRDIINTYLYKDFVDSQTETKLIFNNLINEKTAKHIFLKTTTNRYDNKTISNSLYNIIKDNIETNIKYFNFDNNKTNILSSQELFFAKNSTKISQIETFFCCPYAHFLRYGLRLNENNLADIDARDWGNLLHYVAQKFCEKEHAETDISIFLEGLFDEIKENEKFKKFYLNQQNKIFLSFLKDESYRLCKGLLYHKENSDFKVYKCEYYFSQEIGDMKINGIIDLIDKCNNMYRVIDYKSGNPEINIKDIYYGTGMQPAVYGKVVKQKFGNCSGVFLMPLKNQKSKEQYKLKGFYPKNFDVVKKMDKNICFDNPQSSLLSAKISTKKANIEKNVFELTVGSGNNNFEDILEYSYELTKSAISKIKSGLINCSPLNDTCLYCPYHSVCNFDIAYKNTKRMQDLEIDESSFDLKGGNNGI